MSSNSQSEYIEYGSECYEVQAIRDRKMVKGKPHYFIKWKGWAEEDNTWEPLENLETVIKLVKEFDLTFDSKNNASSIRKDKKLAVESKPPSNNSHNDMPKKTKPIEKENKNKKPVRQKSQGEMSQSEAESSSEQSKKQKTKKIDQREPPRESTKRTSISEGSEKSKQTERQRLKEKERQKEMEREKEKEIERRKSGKQSKGKQSQKSKEKDRERQSEISSNKKNDSKLVNQSKQLENLSKQMSSKPGLDQPLDFIEITRINYHLIVPPEIPNQTPKILYNVDRRNRMTKKSMAVMDISAEEMQKKNINMVVEYLENFLREVEICANQQREYEKKKNGEVPVSSGEIKLGVIGKLRK